jgi:transmembrane sensor
MKLERDNENIDNLLAKYLAGEAHASEQAIVSAWISESLENQRYFNQMKKIFETSSAVDENRSYDTDAAWNKVRQNLENKRGKTIPFQKPTFQLHWWKVAAAIMVFALVGIYIFNSTDDATQSIQVIAGKQAINDTLPDGTNVFLNKKTKLQYAYSKKRKEHNVELEGEAYFHVQHSKDQQFIIKAGEVLIRDIGTSFNVKAYPGSDLVEVLVEEGEIVFYTENNPGIHLKESGKGVYNRKTKQFTIDQPDPNITAYKTKFFVFSGTPLEEVVASLNEVYDSPIVIGENLKNCPITVTFRNETTDEIAAILAETLNLNFEKQGGKLVLTGKGCE